MATFDKNCQNITKNGPKIDLDFPSNYWPFVQKAAAMIAKLFWDVISLALRITPPEYQLSSRVAMSQLKEPRVMKVDTRESKTRWFPSKAWWQYHYYCRSTHQWHQLGTNRCIVILPPGDEGSTGFCTPEYQLSSRVATSQLKEPRVMKVDTRESKTRWFPNKAWW